MEELLRQSKSQVRGWRRGEVTEGIVVEKTRGAIYLDIGGKSEGMVIDREIKAAKDFIKELKVGDKVEAIVTQPENDKGQTLLSLKKASADYLWNQFEEILKTGKTAWVLGKEVNRGGLVVEAKGLQGFIPASQFGNQWIGKIDQLVGCQIEVKPIEINREKKRLIFSEKEISEAELIKELSQVLAKIKVGDIFQGEVTGVMPFGLFVKIEVPQEEKVPRVPKARATRGARDSRGISLEGLVHISEISWQRVENPANFYKVGDEVEIKVLAIEKTTGKLNLSIKQLKQDPWQDIEKKYPIDSKIKGEIIRLAPFGAFVDLEEGIEGLIHISKIPVEKSLKAGDKVDCYIESIDRQGRKMSLGLVLKEKPVGYK